MLGSVFSHSTYVIIHPFLNRSITLSGLYARSGPPSRDLTTVASAQPDISTPNTF